MQTVSAALSAAIEAGSVQHAGFRVLAYLQGDSSAATDLSYLVPFDSPPQRNQDYDSGDALAFGSQSSTCTLTLRGFPASQMQAQGLSPYVASPTNWSRRSYGLGTKFEISEGFTLPSGTVEYVPYFVGVADTFGLDTNEPLTITLLSLQQRLMAKATLPPFYVTDGTPLIATSQMIELLLRGGNFCRSAPLITLSANGVPTRPLLSVPAILPEAGGIAAPLTDWERTAGKFERFAGPSTQNTYLATEPVGWAGENDQWSAQFWFFLPVSVAGTVQLLNIGGVPAGSALEGNSPRMWLQGGKLHAGTYSTATGWTSFLSGTLAAGLAGTWVHARLSVIQNVNSGSFVYLHVNGVQVALLAPDYGPRMLGTGSRKVVLGGCLHEGFQLIWQPRGTDFYSTHAWTPNYTSVFAGTPQFVKAASPVEVGAKVWAVVQQIAADTGARVRFTESGEFRWEERTSFDSRKGNTPAKALTDSNLSSGVGLSWSAEGLRKQVTVDFGSFRVQLPVNGAPVWRATDQIIVEAKQTLEVDFEQGTDLFFGLSPLKNGTGTDSSFSYFRAVQAYQEGDPAASPLPRVQVTVEPTQRGLHVTIVNPYSFDISMWDPATGAVGLVVYGYRSYLWTGKQSVVAPACATATEELIVPSSVWRNRPEAAASLAFAVAAEKAYPVAEIAAVKIARDPRLTLDDVVTVLSAPGVPTPIVCTITGMQDTGLAETTLRLQAAWPAHGWVLGVAGRGELNTNTLLVI